MRLELDVKNHNNEVTRLRALVDRLRAENSDNNREFLRLAELPNKIDPARVQRLIANVKARKDDNLKHKLFYKWRQRHAFNHLKLEDRNTTGFGSFKGFVTLISDALYSLYLKSFPRQSKNDTNSFMLFRNQLQELEPGLSCLLVPFKGLYVE